MAWSGDQATARVADLGFAEKKRDEVWQRYQTQIKLFGQGGNRVTSEEDLRGTQLTYLRYRYEAESKVEAIKVAESELKVAQAKLDQYRIRSPIRGIITRIYKHRGEGVKALEAVLQLRAADE